MRVDAANGGTGAASGNGATALENYLI